jgi:hypothetical protein
VLAACGYHIWRSVNAGATWRAVGPSPYPLPEKFGRIPIFESVAFDPTRRGVVVATAELFATDRPQIWRSINAGRTWRRVAAPVVSRRLPPNRSPRWGLIHVTAGAGRIIAGPYARGSTRVMLSSSNGGVSWTVEPLNTLLPSVGPGSAGSPDPASASGSASALFMPVRQGEGQVLAYRTGAAGWAPLTFFAPPP